MQRQPRDGGRCRWRTAAVGVERDCKIFMSSCTFYRVFRPVARLVRTCGPCLLIAESTARTCCRSRHSLIDICNLRTGDRGSGASGWHEARIMVAWRCASGFRSRSGPAAESRRRRPSAMPDRAAGLLTSLSPASTIFRFSESPSPATPVGGGCSRSRWCGALCRIEARSRSVGRQARRLADTTSNTVDDLVVDVLRSTGRLFFVRRGRARREHGPRARRDGGGRAAVVRRHRR